MSVTSGAPAHMWFVQIGGEVWGPYPEARIAEFVREGRVRSATLLSPFAAGPWSLAADSAEFAAGFRAAPPEAGPSARTSQAVPVTAASADRAAAPARTPTSSSTPLERSAAPTLAARAPARTPTSSSTPLERSAAPTLAARGPTRPVLVFAGLASVAPAAFHAALARLGPCVQVRPDLWLVRSAGGPAALRNLLSAHLGGDDSLLVVEAPLEQAAWFNLASAHDRELRRLWSGG